jgi:hypothetical protein
MISGWSGAVESKYILDSFEMRNLNQLICDSLNGKYIVVHAFLQSVFKTHDKKLGIIML